MKVIIGDMSFEDEIHEAHRAYTSEQALEHKEAHARLRSDLDKFLETAQTCYITRHGSPPERTTKDEF